MKLVLAVVQADDASACCDALAAAGFAVTRLAAVGGFLGRENTAILTGVDDARVDEAIDELRKHARARVEELAPMVGGAQTVDLLGTFAVEVEVGGATIFVLPVERFERL